MDKQKEKILKEKSELLKVIAHPTRLCIINCLMEKECNVTALVNKMDVPQSTVSQHISKLKLMGIIKGNKRGTEIIYKVVNEDVKRIVALLLEELN